MAANVLAGARDQRCTLLLMARESLHVTVHVRERTCHLLPAADRAILNRLYRERLALHLQARALRVANARAVEMATQRRKYGTRIFSG